jgi:uncharacterized membrane protein
MPLTKCKGCGASISTLAKACPHCGQPSTATAVGQVGMAMIGCGLFLMLVGLLIVLPILLAVF